MTNPFIFVRTAISVSVVTLFVTACTSPPNPDPSPEPTPSVLMKAIPADDDSKFYGIAATGAAQDQYGDYAALRISDISIISSRDAAEIDEAVTDVFDKQAIEFAARYLTKFLVEWYIDTPLVFDDSPEVRDRYWADTASRWGDADFMRATFDERSELEPWALIDDDRGQWRQNGDPAYGPATYVVGEPRTKIQKIQLVHVRYDEIEWRGVTEPLMKFQFDVTYDREVVFANGTTGTEHTSGHVGFSFGRLEGLDGPITGVNWGMSTRVGHYIDGGVWGLPVTSSSAEPLGATVAVGHELFVPTLEGFTTVSDLDRAQERGIEVTSFEAPDMTVSYYEGPEFDANAGRAVGGDEPDFVNEYVFTVFDPTPKPDVLSPSDALREAAGEYGEEKYFFGFGGEAMRLKGPGIAKGYVDLSPAMFDETYDIVTLYVVSEAGPDYFARYYVTKGHGVDTYNDVLKGWSFLPVAREDSGLRTPTPVG